MLQIKLYNYLVRWWVYSMFICLIILQVQVGFSKLLFKSQNNVGRYGRFNIERGTSKYYSVWSCRLEFLKYIWLSLHYMPRGNIYADYMKNRNKHVLFDVKIEKPWWPFIQNLLECHEIVIVHFLYIFTNIIINLKAVSL